MDLTPTNTNTPTPKSPEPETETPTRIQQPTKPLTFTNGVLKRHHPAHHHHLHHHPVVITYKECLKNHAATLGGHALDGCGEFMPSPSSNPSDPTSLKCAACGCHRNFHRREPDESPPSATVTGTTTAIEFQSHHRHHPPPPPLPHRSPNSASPPPISSSYYPSSAPHMLLALSGSHGPDNNNNLAPNSNINLTSAAVIGSLSNQNPNSRKRFRTKFSQYQKEKMLQFAERVGWKMQKRDEELVHSFCNDVGVDKNVFKVWMHNNKNNFTAKKDSINGGRISGNLADSSENHNNDNGGSNDDNGGQNLNNHHEYENDGTVAHVVGTNGSSSSS